MVNLRIVCVCPSVSVTAGRDFLILGTMIGYGLDMIVFIQSVIADVQRKILFLGIGSNCKRYTTGCAAGNSLGLFSPIT